MKQSIITIGIPTSGKSTYANNVINNDPSYIELSRDKIRRDIFNTSTWSDGYNSNIENEKIVTSREYDLIREYSNNNQNIVITDANLRMKYVKNLVNILEHFGYEVYIKMCDITLVESLRRNELRHDPIDTETIERLHDIYNTVTVAVTKRYPQYII